MVNSFISLRLIEVLKKNNIYTERNFNLIFCDVHLSNSSNCYLKFSDLIINFDLANILSQDLFDSLFKTHFRKSSELDELSKCFINPKLSPFLEKTTISSAFSKPNSKLNLNKFAKAVNNLVKEKIDFNDEIILALANHEDPENLARAFITLHSQNILSDKNRAAIVSYENPELIANTLTFLNIDNYEDNWHNVKHKKITLDDSQLELLKQHEDPLDLAVAFKFLKAADIFLPEYISLVAENKHPIAFAKALSCLFTANILNEENVKLLINHKKLQAFYSAIIHCAPFLSQVYLNV